MESSKRTFASGSRQAPDPFDQYLEREGFYRKHVARDATCLFRTFSEQVFDVQMYHVKVRDDCIRWMRKNSDHYSKKISGDFDEYLSEMSKLRSYGSFIELHALAHAYRRNVLLFEPYNLGTWFVRDDEYQQNVMVFFSPEKHFDSIFPAIFIQQAAYCQALVYEILYVKVFKLPDVIYSVERMLHDPEGKSMDSNKLWDNKNKFDEDRFVTSEGKQLVFNTAEDTNCVLDNYLLCHFHNKEDFDTIIATYRIKKNEYDVKKTRNTNINNNPRVLINPMLCDSKISCVRQLLKEGITPFPYKVAKALDPNIYRNIEFDSWNEMRRELRYQNWQLDQNRIQVGAKCMVQLYDLDDRLFVGYVQEMNPNKGPCVVYVEDVGEYHTIPYDRLQVIPLDQTSSSVIPLKFRKSAVIHQSRVTHNKNSRKKTPKVSNFTNINLNLHDSNKYHSYTPYHNEENSFCYSIADFTTINNFTPNHMEVMVMPFSGGKFKTRLNNAANEPGGMIDESHDNDTRMNAETTTYSTSSVHNMSTSSCSTFNSAPYCYTYSDSGPYAPSAYLPYSAQQAAFTSHGFYPGAFNGLPYAIVSPLCDTMTEHQTTVNIPDFQATVSKSLNGSDLPLHDLTTLRYFYNLGIDFFQHHQFYFEPLALASTPRNNESSCSMDNKKKKEHDMVLSACNATDAKNKQRGLFQDKIPNSKRKYGAKYQKRLTDIRSNWNKVSFSDPCLSSVVPTLYQDAKQTEYTSTIDHIAADIPQSHNSESLPYSHVPRNTPIRVPYYTLDASHYMIPAYGPGFITIPSDAQHAPFYNALEMQYSPILFAPHIGTGYVFMGNPPKLNHINYDDDSNADNNFNFTVQ